MSKHWPRVPLRNIVSDLTKIRTFTVQPDDFITDPTITSATHTISSAGTKVGLEVKVEKRVRIEPCDLVFSRLHTQNGAFAFSEGNFQATGTFVPLQVNEEIAHKRFLFWALHKFVPTLSASDTVGRETFRTEEILALEIPLPPLDEQRRTVARIEELAVKVHEARALREQASEEAALIQYATMRRCRHILLELNFPKVPIGEITTVTSGGTPSRDNPSYWNGNIPWIKTGELLDGDILSAEEQITDAGVANSSAKIFPPHTVLLALYGQGLTRGRTGRLLIPAATNQACCAILPNEEKLDPRFVQYWLRGLYFELREQAQGGAQPNWNGGMIKALIIPLAPISEQRRIVAELDTLQAEVDTLKRHQAETTAELDALLPAILDRAFRGEL
ncbi:MAG: restriction endonuclease subunit S [Rhodocyclaceae bacterium]|nr:restriction endonuclease subunit S [Rhodocyclaceae bacterium]